MQFAILHDSYQWTSQPRHDRGHLDDRVVGVGGGHVEQVLRQHVGGDMYELMQVYKLVKYLAWAQQQEPIEGVPE